MCTPVDKISILENLLDQAKSTINQTSHMWLLDHGHVLTEDEHHLALDDQYAKCTRQWIPVGTSKQLLRLIEFLKNRQQLRLCYINKLKAELKKST